MLNSMSTTEETTGGLQKLIPPLKEDIKYISGLITITFERVTSKSSHPNVLVVGQSGSGKSTLINTIFRTSITTNDFDEGSITKLYEYKRPSRTTQSMHLSPCASPIINLQQTTLKLLTQKVCDDDYEGKTIKIYDSKGISFTDTTNYTRNIREFMNDKKEDEQIHIIWFVINSATGRIQPFEEELCKGIFKDKFIIFVLNKCDISTQSNRKTIHDSIEEMKLTNCLGIYEVVSGLEKEGIKNVTQCTKCGGNEIVIKMKSKQAACCNCQNEIDISSQIDDVINCTYSNLEMITRRFFIESLVNEFKDKITVVRNCVVSVGNLQTMEQDLLNYLLNVLKEISCQFGFDSFANGSGYDALKELCNTNSGITEKIGKIIGNNSRKEMLRISAIVLEWYKFLRTLKWMCIKIFCEKDCDVDSVIIEGLDLFSEFEETQIIEETEMYGISSVLEQEEEKFKEEENCDLF